MDEYTDDQICEWTKEDLLNAPFLSDKEIQELRTNKRYLTAQSTQKLRVLIQVFIFSSHFLTQTACLV